MVFSLDGNGAASLGLPWPMMRNNTMECLLSTGVANIHRFVTATEKEQRRIISSEAGNDTIISRHSLEAALEHYPPRPLRG